MNAKGRFVLAPPSQWPSDIRPGSAGFIGKITKVTRVVGGHTATLKFADKTEYIPFNKISEWTLLS
eukprot:7386286-Prymnesium_polylepis.1